MGKVLTTGVPQGSILSSLVFNIYVLLVGKFGVSVPPVADISSSLLSSMRLL